MKDVCLLSYLWSQSVRCRRLSSLSVIRGITMKTNITLYPFVFLTKIYTILFIADVGVELSKKVLVETFFFSFNIWQRPLKNSTEKQQLIMFVLNMSKYILSKCWCCLISMCMTHKLTLLLFFCHRQAKTSWELYWGHVAEATRCSGCHPEQHLYQVQSGRALSGLLSVFLHACSLISV